MDNFKELENINSMILEKLGGQGASFAEIIHRKNQARASGDQHKEFLLIIFAASLFMKKKAHMAAEEWIRKAKELVPILSSDFTAKNDLSLLADLERLTKQNVSIKTSSEGNSLLDKLMTGLLVKPMSRVELIEFLFHGIDFESAENRLKNLLHRAKKQFPNQIVKVNGVYSIPIQQKR